MTSNKEYTGDRLNRVAFPLGGMGAGMFCMEGTGTISHMSVRHKPQVYHEPEAFAALYVKGAKSARVIEGPVRRWKAFGSLGEADSAGNGNGLRQRTSYGLPRFSEVSFQARFPFGIVKLQDQAMPVRVELTGWSPFIPGNADDSSLPVAAFEYRLVNRTAKSVSGVFSFHSVNFMRSKTPKAGEVIAACDGGFVLAQPTVADKPAEEGYFAVFSDDPGVKVDCAWFRGGWFDPLTMVWKSVEDGKAISAAPHADRPGTGGSLYVPFKLTGHGSKVLRICFAWYVPRTDIQAGKKVEAPTTGGSGACCSGEGPKNGAYSPWYVSRFGGIGDVVSYWRKNYRRLLKATRLFSDTFYDTSLPDEVVEAVAANLGILKSPTCLRQHDGRFWAWEGCSDNRGCCHGSCTHVWNYAQSLAHLFPDLERSLRETEYLVNQDERGHQAFRSNLPISETRHDFHAAADGQLGGLMKLFREWRVSGDTAWMKRLWPAAKRSMDYGIATWDPDHTGTLIEPHHNTYDIEFWGADGMCTSFYLGALAATIRMGRECGADVALYEELLALGKSVMETSLWNGAYFHQKVQWSGLRAADPSTAPAGNTNYSAEATELLRREGPKYQYGTGCLSDGVLGDWLARCCGLELPLDADKVTRHLLSVYCYNFRKDLSDHVNTQRPGYAFGKEGGLLLCTWPKGDKLSLPFPYSNEVWTGIEYQVASHLVMAGRVREGRAIVRAARKRYDGRDRNPFDEYECGHWYARAMASYGLLQAFSGARYDAVEKTLYLKPSVKGDLKAFLCTASGYGTVRIRKGKPSFTTVSGKVPIKRIAYE